MLYLMYLKYIAYSIHRLVILFDFAFAGVFKTREGFKSTDGEGSRIGGSVLSSDRANRQKIGSRRFRSAERLVFTYFKPYWGFKLYQISGLHFYKRLTSQL